ncbi:MAG: succinate dehydrogenase [Armatimonadetes bacterium]|nr:succinate dehydrogenase [Armatimonadota bacterium]
MAVSLARENYVLHRIHSITGVMPVGYYMAQHLTLNTFSLAGPEKFNAVIEFFEGMPKHFLLATEILMIWIPLLFHAIYGLFIISRAESFLTTKYKWSQSRMFMMQRISGVLVFAFLMYHVSATTATKYVTGDAKLIKFNQWHDMLHNPIILLIYIFGVLGASYHLGYGLWNFCVRWGITVSDKAQLAVQKFSAVVMVALTLMGWAALAGFLINKPLDTGMSQSTPAPTASTTSFQR